MKKANQWQLSDACALSRRDCYGSDQIVRIFLQERPRNLRSSKTLRTDDSRWIELARSDTAVYDIKQLCRLLAFPATGSVSSSGTGGEIVRAVPQFKYWQSKLAVSERAGSRCLGGQTSEQYAWARRRHRLITRPHREEGYTRPDEY